MAGHLHAGGNHDVCGAALVGRLPPLALVPPVCSRIQIMLSVSSHSCVRLTHRRSCFGVMPNPMLSAVIAQRRVDLGTLSQSGLPGVFSAHRHGL